MREMGALSSGRAAALGISAVKHSRASMEHLRTLKLS